MLIVVACSTSQQKASDTTSTLPVTQAKATLSHVPSGTSELKWDAATQKLTVKVSLIGLAPKSTHIGHIHEGDCNSDGATIYPLTDLVADDKGAGTSETTIADVKTGIPQNGWYINIHNGGTGLTPELQKIPIACADIANSNTSTSSDQSVTVKFKGTSAPNQSASGDANLSLENGKLTVKVTLSGLVPNSTHIVHLHDGTCVAQGAVHTALDPIVADASGYGTSTTTIDSVDSIPSNVYVNVHFGGTMEELSTQTGNDPIACGDVALS
jgi:hypothetical protein